MNEIVKTLTLMCDKANPQDKKLLLLAELVETKCDALAQRQGNLQDSLEKTSAKLDKLTELLEKYEKNEKGCPVYQNREGFEKISFFMKYPRLTLLILAGALSIVGGFFGKEFVTIIKLIIGA